MLVLVGVAIVTVMMLVLAGVTVITVVVLVLTGMAVVTVMVRVLAHVPVHAMVVFMGRRMHIFLFMVSGPGRQRDGEQRRAGDGGK